VNLNTSSHEKTIFSIAGSDPSGGAGIQADIKTFTTLGVYGCAAITCLTAQNTKGVASYLPVDPAFVKKQINLVLEDIRPDHIKIGMVGNGEIAIAIGECLDTFQGVIIYDPVLKASSGQSLFEPGDSNALSACIIEKATILTPNTKELQALTQLECDTAENIMQAAQRLLDKFPNLTGVVVTGGHFQEQSDLITDFLFLKDTADTVTHKTATHPRIKSTNTHGTGCTFSSAFTSYHLLTGNYEKAFHNAIAFSEKLIMKSAEIKIGTGNGPLSHHLFPRK
jgi:hydroxymethylpyrimidine/phosphomethylpyrimidine kinase